MSSVLFLCVHNAGRSQMAKALFNRMARERGLSSRAESAGTEPARRVHENVVDAMDELGLDLVDERPKLLTNEMLEKADRVITMGCAVDSASCPAVLLKDVEDWGLPDPKGMTLQETRAVRDDIQRRVEELLSSMSRGGSPR